MVLGLLFGDDLIGILRVPSSLHLKIGGLELHVGEGDINTADGAGVRAVTGVRERLNRQRSAVLDLYSPLMLLQLLQN